MVLKYSCNRPQIVHMLVQYDCGGTIVCMPHHKVLHFDHKLLCMLHTYICSCQ